MKFTLSRASQIGLCLCHIMSSTTRGGHAQTDIYTHAQVQAPTNVCASQRISISIGLHIYLYWPTGVLSIVIKQKKKKIRSTYHQSTRTNVPRPEPLCQPNCNIYCHQSIKLIHQFSRSIGSHMENRK